MMGAEVDMRRPVAALIAAVAIVVTGGTFSPARPADLPEVTQRGTLRVLVMPDTRRPEFFSLAPGAPPGFEASAPIVSIHSRFVWLSSGCAARYEIPNAVASWAA